MLRKNVPPPVTPGKSLSQLIPPGRRLPGNTIFLRRLGKKDAPALRALLDESRKWLKPWAPPVSDPLLLNDIVKRIAKAHREAKAGRRLELGIFSHDRSVLMGVISLHTVVYGVAHSAGLGYWVGERFGGRGVIKQAVAAMTAFAIEEAGLHRIWAGVQESNVRSWRVLERLGFTYEGNHRQEIFIDGDWRDQRFYTLLNHEYDRMKEAWARSGWLLFSDTR